MFSSAIKLLRSQRGQSVVEVIVAVSLFVIISSSAVVAVLSSFSTTALAQDETKATLLANEGGEAVRSIRDENWSALIDGDHGLSDTSGSWTFSGTSDQDDKFSRTVTIQDVYRNNGQIVTQGGTLDPDTKKIIVTVAWQPAPNRKDTITFNQYLTNWQTITAVLNPSSPTSTPAPTPTNTPSPTPSPTPTPSPAPTPTATPTPTPAPCSIQANCLTVDISSVKLAQGGKQIAGITVGNTSASTITISKMTIQWTGGSNGSVMNAIRINGSTVWTGSATSGTIVTITNVSLSPNSSGIPVNYIQFSKSMTGATFSIQFGMSDGSHTTISGISP